MYIAEESGCALWKRLLLVMTKEFLWQVCFFPSHPPLADSMTISFWLNSSVLHSSVFPFHFLSSLLFPFHYTPLLCPRKNPSPPSRQLRLSLATTRAQEVQAPLYTVFFLYWRADSSSSPSLTAVTMWCLTDICLPTERSDGSREIRSGVRRRCVGLLEEKLLGRNIRCLNIRHI